MHYTIKITDDGTTTLYTPKFNQLYHSRFGARWEAERVYIELGFMAALHRFESVKILELGFGTGFNALLTQEKVTELQAEKYFQTEVHYTGIEAFPIGKEDAMKLNYDVLHFHELSWGEEHQINSHFSFQKEHVAILDFEPSEKYNLVYFDAFAPSSQPELWTVEVFEKVASFMEPDAILTTYCSKSFVQRNMRAAGFEVEKHQGPPRKREVLRAILKND